ncbi:type I polyketide synthase [Pendulispora albinea]|uniref:Acyltransferase domain-containing protein n=1 Tax=Pendulispora albinea TaxID=2741071 RepID=A0ABZ2LS86_9BACT
MSNITFEGARSAPIAIVGIGCRLPGGIVDPTSFLRFLASRGDGIVPVPADRWSLDRYWDPDPNVPGRTYASRGGFLRQNVFAFEPEPFGISPREAASLDPQQALLLETAWEALEDAGIPLERITGSATGVYIGSFGVDNHPHRLWGAGRRGIDLHVSTAVTPTMLSARLAYTFDLRGPTLTLDTACSSSLVAIHLACRALRDGDCDAALAGGVNVMVLPSMMIALAKSRFAATDGRSKSFDATGDGYGRGEGAAVVVLKRLHTALADGDRIYGVVLGSAINQDGRTEGITVPSGAAQEELIRKACAAAAISPADVGYVEAHGTGTKVGDPIEARALGRVYGHEGRAAALCSIGSVKSNIGHLEAAAGVVGMVKACLMQREGRVLPQLGPNEVNPDLELEASGLRIATDEHAWPADRPLAAVNSFGYGGTNAHVILAPPPADARRARPEHGERREEEVHVRSSGLAEQTPVPLSAYSEAALRARAGDLHRWLEEHGDGDLGDLLHTLARRRSHLPARACVLAGSRDELLSGLEALREGRAVPEVVLGTAAGGPAPKVAWVFTGMGPQRAGMARELLAEEPVFRREVEACDALFRELSGWSILEALIDPAQAERLRRNDVAQVANFVVQAGLTALLRSLGAAPDGVIGHSVGELGAAYAAGMLSRRDAIVLVHHRARASQSAAGHGTMLAAGISAEDAAALIEPGDDACVAAINGPRSVTFAGDRAALAKIARVLDDLGVFQRSLSVEVAYHSAHLDPVREALLQCWNAVHPQPSQVEIYSTVTGERVGGEPHGAAYWWRNLREPVRFAQAARAMIADGYRVFLEVGPHPVLATYLRELLAEADAQGHTLHTLERDMPERLSTRRAIAALHGTGARIDWSAIAHEGHPIALPPYPWQRAVHWAESAAMRAERLGSDYAHPFLQTRLEAPHPTWTSWLEGSAAAYLQDHRVQGVSIAPAAFYVEAGLAMARALEPEAAGLVLGRLRFHEPLLLAGETQVSVCAMDGGRFEVHGQIGERAAWTRHASGEWATTRTWPGYEAESLDAVRGRLSERIEIGAAYDAMARRQLDYGPRFRSLRDLHRNAGEVLARLELPELPPQARFGAILLPPLLDGVFQSLVEFLGGGAIVVHGVEELSLRVPGDEGAWTRLWSHATIVARDERSLIARVTLYDGDGAIVGRLSGVRCQMVDAGASRASRASFAAPGAPAAPEKRWLYAQRWELRPSGADELPGGSWAFYGGSMLARRLVEHWRQRDRDASSRPAPEGANALPDPRAAHHVVVLDTLEDMFGTLAGIGALAGRLVAGGWSELTVLTTGAVQARANDTVSPAMHACWGYARALERELAPLRLRLIDTAPGADPETLASVFSAEGEDEVAIRGTNLYVARLEHLDLASLRTTVDPTAACVTWSPERGWTALPPPRQEEGPGEGGARKRPPPRSVRIQRFTTFPMAHVTESRSSMLAISTALDPTTNERGVVVTDGPPATELRLAPSAFFRTETAPSANQLAAALGRYVAHALLRLPNTPGAGVVWVAPSLPWLAAWLDRAGVPRVRDVTSDDSRIAAIALSTRSELGPEVLRRVAEQGVVGVVSPPGENASLWDALPNGWALTRLDVRESLVDAPHKLAAWLPEPAHTRTETPSLPLTMLDRATTSEPQTFDVSAHPHLEALDARTLRVTADDTWWITGGTRGLGLVIAEWLLEQGAKRLILTSRTGQIDDLDRARLEARAARATEAARATQAAGAAPAAPREAAATIEIATLDIADGNAVHAFVSALQRRNLTPTAIVHAAARYEDAPVAHVDRDMFERVFQAKALGAWHLHQATRALRIDHFILCSSVTALLGNALQTAYAAANAYLDGLSALRQSQGLPARSIAWGALLDAGILAREEAIARDVEASGLRRMKARDAWEVLAALPPSAPAHVAIFDGDWPKLFRGLRLPARARWGALQPAARETAEGGVASILRGVDPGRHLDVLGAAIRDRAAAVLRTAADRIDPDRPLRDYGFDSLLAIELRIALDAQLGAGLTTMEILTGASARTLARAVLRDRALSH